MPSSRGSNRVCAIPCCPNPRDAQYYAFPTKNLELQRLWIAKCRRSDRIGVKNAKICDRHFTPNDYQRNLKAELLGITARKKLKSDAVPSLLIPGSSDSSISKSSREIRQENRERKELVSRLLEESEVQESKLESEDIMDTSHGITEYKEEPLTENVIDTSHGITEYKEEPLTENVIDISHGIIEYKEEPLTENVMDTSHGITEYKEEPLTKTAFTQVDVYKLEKGIQCEESEGVLFLERKCKKLEKQLSLTKMQLSRYKAKCLLMDSKKYKKNLIKTFLEKNNSAIQTRRIMNLSTKFNRGYSKEDVTTALILRRISPLAFEYLRSLKLLALPSRQTQENFLKDFKYEPGFIEDSIKSIAEKMSYSKNKDKD